ncbi:hypothetical protein ASF47_18760 [Nocardioides sp. Leaf285]|nr:hypothetical protein ASF47_18760 [Nocardioides sp. Leaf285]
MIQPAAAQPAATLRIVEADHTADAFWTLGEVVHEVPARRLFEALPERPCGNPATHSGSCFIVDLLDVDGEVVDDCEITEQVAQALLDEPIPVLRERFRTWLFETYGATG